MAISANCPCRRWNTTQWVVVGTLAFVILVAIPVVIITSIVLRPRQIHLSITNSTQSGIPGSGKALHLNLSTSIDDRHAWVVYRSVMVDLLYNVSKFQYSIAADVSTASMPLRQPPRSTVTMDVSANFTKDIWEQDFENRSDKTEIQVKVATVVQFIVGGAYTRPYEVSVRCDLADFFNPQTSYPLNCTG
ncbi:hypothetical protein ACP70R_000838 [Stipagrostis hirtigluma subsp. patula]